MSSLVYATVMSCLQTRPRFKMLRSGAFLVARRGISLPLGLVDVRWLLLPLSLSGWTWWPCAPQAVAHVNCTGTVNVPLSLTHFRIASESGHSSYIAMAACEGSVTAAAPALSSLRLSPARARGGPRTLGTSESRCASRRREAGTCDDADVRLAALGSRSGGVA